MIGEKIKELRNKSGLTQKKLGDLCGIAEPTIRKYELGLLNPKIETVSKIAAALNVSVAEIMDWSQFDDKFPNIGNEVRLIDEIKNVYGSGAVELLESFAQLNSKGQEKALDSLSDLTMIEQYIKKD